MQLLLLYNCFGTALKCDYRFTFKRLWVSGAVFINLISFETYEWLNKLESLCPIGVMSCKQAKASEAAVLGFFDNTKLISGAIFTTLS